MQEPVETIIISVQQSIESAGGLNPIQIEIEDDRVVSMLKKDKERTFKVSVNSEYLEISLQFSF